MAGYLDQYGAGDEGRERTNRRLLCTLAIALGALVLWWFLFRWDKSEILRAEGVARLVQKLRHHNQESEVQQFLDLVKNHQYDAAYRAWHPNNDYPFTKFMEDWGPQSQRRIGDFAIVKSRSCGSGVIITVNFIQDGQENLWVQRADQSLSFSPYPVCPAGS